MAEPLPVFRIDVTSTLSNRANALLAQIPSIGVHRALLLEVSEFYFLEGDLDAAAIDRIGRSLLTDPVIERFAWRRVSAEAETGSAPQAIEVAFLPGVTDNTAAQLLRAAHRLGYHGLQSAATGSRYVFSGDDIPEAELHLIAQELLVNATIRQYALGEIRPDFLHPPTELRLPQGIDLAGLDNAGLLALSAGRRLALNLHEMETIRDYFLSAGRPATDAELETIAQTWSEHCVHKTFKARIRLPGGETVDSMLRSYLQAATDAIGAPWVRSAFTDNAGVIEFDDEYDLSFKVETHNHPSAIEPFGGANTGVGGVVRDVLGVSHRPVALTDVLCFGPPDLPRASLPHGVLHPARVRAGVVHGIEDYGNKLGLPTVNGAVLYHPGYTANPLVFCGCVGIGPRDAHPRSPQPGDRIVLIGGRTGRDGLRGATFSSLTMDAQTGQVAGASVQIGDPVTEKGVIEVIERARDLRLYHAVTDCGAGGLSSAIGEMGEHTGARVDLARVPLKYAGLEPWEIWLSEAQERMVLAVPSENLPALQALCETYWVEMSDIGEFGGEDRRLLVVHTDFEVVDLEMAFLHACPRLELEAVPPPRRTAPPNAPAARSSPPLQTLLALLSHPNIASKESIVRLYDHEVRGMTVVKPLAGLRADGPSDAAVLKPLETAGWRGIVLSNGINPLVGEVDPYAMALLAVDEAIRNAVAVGADPERIAILDNFCWGSPQRPETLGGLVEAARGCRDAALRYRTPFISGKDSLNNEYLSPDGERHAIPGTLLISALGIHPDVRKSVTMDLKTPGSLVYLVGDWQPFLAGSHVAALLGGDAGLLPAAAVSGVAPSIYRALHQAIHAGLIRAAHDLSEGGLSVAAAEMAIAGRCGLRLDLSTLHEDPSIALFGETGGCLLVEVLPVDEEPFEMLFAKLPFRRVGAVTGEAVLQIDHQGERLVSASLGSLSAAFRGGSAIPEAAAMDVAQRGPRASRQLPGRVEQLPGAAARRVLVLHAPGTNRDGDLAQAIRAAGGVPEIVPLSRLAGGELRPEDFAMLALPGGFSYGDALGAGRLWALELVSSFDDLLGHFIDRQKAVIGVCNGFQALVKAGALPGNDRQATLTFNSQGHFECRWVTLAPNPANPSPWLSDLEPIDCPVAHGEGRFLQPAGESLRLEEIALFYAGPGGMRAAGAYPANPNGSPLDIAGITNADGNILGLMPHPENHIHRWQHPAWTRGGRLSLGLRLFENGLKLFR